MGIKKDQMTKNERWGALFKRAPLDRVPVYGFSHAYAWNSEGLSREDLIRHPQKIFNAMNRVSEKFGWQDLAFICYAELGVLEFGGKVPEGNSKPTIEVPHNPILEPENLDSMEMPDVRKAGILPIAMEVSRLQAQNRESLVMVQTSGPWAVACSIFGMMNMVRWVLRNPDLVHKILRKVLPFSISILAYWVETFGADHVLPWIGGSASASNSIISPKVFADFFLPYMKELYEAAHHINIKHIFIHICGKQKKNLPYWGELNFGDPGILSFGKEVDLETAGKLFPKDIIMGNIDTKMLVLGTPEEVYDATKVTIEKGKTCPGGFILAPGCELPLQTPEKNLWAMMQAVSDYGWY